MAGFEIFVDTGINGAAVAFKNSAPVNYVRFRRDKAGAGIQLLPFLNFCQSFKHKSNTICFVEDPAKVPRSISTTSTQYIVVGQILTICELVHRNAPILVSSNQWGAWVKRSLNNGEKDPKERSRQFARSHYPEFIQEYFGSKRLHDGVADCLCLGAFVTLQQGELFSRL